MTRRLPYLTARLQGFGTTIFAEMSALAVRTGAINLGQGFPDSDGPAAVSSAAIEAIKSGHNQYPPGAGIHELRTAIAEHQLRFWGLEYDPEDEILVTAGATEAIAAALLALCEVGDEVVTFEPFYDSYQAGVAMAGAAQRVVTISPPDYAFSVDALAAAITPKTRLVLLNSPHNPTGKVFSAAELAAIADLCVRHDLIAVTDEVYEHLIFDGSHVPLATLPGMRERTVTISSGGKTFSFTGWKVGWACAPAPLLAAVRTAKQFLTYVNGAPFQFWRCACQRRRPDPRRLRASATTSACFWAAIPSRMPQNVANEIGVRTQTTPGRQLALRAALDIIWIDDLIT